jgi:hypothetical protein
MCSFMFLRILLSACIGEFWDSRFRLEIDNDFPVEKSCIINIRDRLPNSFVTNCNFKFNFYDVLSHVVKHASLSCPKLSPNHLTVAARTALPDQ